MITLTGRSYSRRGQETFVKGASEEVVNIGSVVLRQEPSSSSSGKLLDVDRTRVVHTYRKDIANQQVSSASVSETVTTQTQSKKKSEVPSSKRSNSVVKSLRRAGYWLRMYVIAVVGCLSCVVGGYLFLQDYNRALEDRIVISPEIEPLVSRYQDLDDYFGSEPLALIPSTVESSTVDMEPDVTKENAPKVSFTGNVQPTSSATSATVKRMMIRLITQKVYDVVKRYPAKMDPVEVTSLIMSESLKAGFDPLLVASVIRVESAFNPKAKSSVGARGLMQIMPGTKKFIEKMEKIKKADSKSLEEPQYNLRLGIAYLKYLIKKYNGNRGYALMAYNWGPGHLSRALKRSKKAKVPASVQRYAVKILDSHSVWNSQLTTTLLFEDY